MWKSIILLGSAILLSLSAFAQESLKYSQIPLNLLDQGSETPTIKDNPNFLWENRIPIQQLLPKVDQMPIARTSKDFNSAMPITKLPNNIHYNMPIVNDSIPERGLYKHGEKK